MIGGGPIAWITKIYLSPSLRLRPRMLTRAGGSWPFCRACQLGDQPEQEDAAGLQAIARRHRDAPSLLMVMNILTSAVEHADRASLDSPSHDSPMRLHSTAIIAAEPGAARCSVAGEQARAAVAIVRCR